MKKFKFLTKLLAVMVIIPAIFLCTACGGQLAQEAKLEKKQFNEISTATEFQTKMDAVTQGETAITTGYHMSMSMQSPLMGMEKYELNMYYIPGETAETTKMAAKYDVVMKVEEVVDTSMQATIYGTDGFVYSDITGTATMGSVTTDLTAKTKAPMLDFSDEMLAMAEMYTDLGSLLTQMDVTAMAEVEGVKFYVSTDETQLKMVVNPGTVVEEGIKANKFEFIVQFAEGKVQGFMMDIDMEITEGTETIAMAMKVAIVPFAGEIDMPTSFEGYQEA